jgi:hypothetical protein
LNELPNASELRNLALPTAEVAAEPQSDKPTETQGAVESPESRPADIREPEAETDSKIAFAPGQTDHQLNSTDGE